MAGDLRRLDTVALGAAAVGLDDLAAEVAASRVRATATLARAGVPVPTEVATLAGVSAALTGQAHDLRARIGLVVRWDESAATTGWRIVRTVRESLEHLDDAEALLGRLPEADRLDDPLEALVAAARSGHLTASSLLAALRPHLDSLLRRPDGLEVLVARVEATVPDAPDVGLLPLLLDLAANEVAGGSLPAVTASVLRETVAALVHDALASGDDIGPIVDALGRVDDDLVHDLLPSLTADDAARLLLALAQRDELDLGVTAVLPLLAVVMSDADALGTLGSRALATLLSLIARSDGTPMVDGIDLAVVLTALGPRLRSGGDLPAVQDADGRALLTEADVRRLIALGDASVRASVIDAGLAELEAMLTSADGTIPREVSAELGHRLRSVGEWLGTVADVVSDAAADHAGRVEAFQDALALVATAAVPGVGAGIAAGVVSTWIDGLAGSDREAESDVDIAAALETALRSAAGHAIPALAISAVMDGFRAAAMDS